MSTQPGVAHSAPWYVARMHNWDHELFSELLRDLMTSANLSQQDVADIAGISRPQVSRWMSGAHRPGFDALQRLAATLRSDHPRLEATVTGLVLAAGYEGGVPQPGPSAPGGDGPPPEADGDRPAGDVLATLTAEQYAALTPEQRQIAREVIEGLRRAAEARIAADAEDKSA